MFSLVASLPMKLLKTFVVLNTLEFGFHGRQSQETRLSEHQESNDGHCRKSFGWRVGSFSSFHSLSQSTASNNKEVVMPNLEHEKHAPAWKKSFPNNDIQCHPHAEKTANWNIGPSAIGNEHVPVMVFTNSVSPLLLIPACILSMLQALHDMNR